MLLPAHATIFSAHILHPARVNPQKKNRGLNGGSQNTWCMERSTSLHSLESAAQRGVEPGSVMSPGEFDSVSSYDRMLPILGKKMDLVKTDASVIGEENGFGKNE